VVGDGDVEVGIAGGEVIGWECEVDVLVTSLHPQKCPGVWQVGDDEADEVVVGSLQRPKYPGEWHVIVLVGEVILAVGTDVEILLVVVTSSLQPNQPGVLQVEVEVVVVVDDVVVTEVVVVSSRHPHQPGV